MTEKSRKIEIGESGSKLQTEFEQDLGLADRYLAEANVKNLYELYHKRCRQLSDLAATICTMSDLYAGKKEVGMFPTQTPDAIAAMERVAIAAIELAKSVTGSKS